MMRMKKKFSPWVILAISILAAALLLCGYSSLEEKVFDQADILDSDEEDDLREDIAELARTMSLDIIIVTTDDAEGKSARDYADDFYDGHGFGYEKSNGSGILFLIDMDNREAYISTAGTAIEMYTDRDIDRMLDDHIMPCMYDGDYYYACLEFLECVETYGTNDDVAHNGYYDKEQDAFIEYTPEQIRANERAAARKRILSPAGILSRLAISMVIGAAAVGVMMLNVRSQKAAGGRVYLKQGSERVNTRQDYKTNTTVTSRRIPQNDGNSGRSGGGGGHSSSHSSSGGHSHGGGGRSF